MSIYIKPNFLKFNMECFIDNSALAMLKHPHGQAGVKEFINLAVRVSAETTKEGLNPGLKCSGTGSGAPYVNPQKGIVRARCANWDSGEGCSLSLFFFFFFPFFFSLRFLVCGAIKVQRVRTVCSK
jgi:hypothetical protein